MTMNDAVFFWRASEKPFGCFSQWHSAGFDIDGVHYRCAEQWMMASKARLFNDEATLARIMAATNPVVIKRLGRAVKPFDGAKWGAACLEAVVQGNYAKFSQHPELKEILLSTESRLIAEASPKDKLWGIGIDAATAAAFPLERWPGKNLLGQALMKVREMLGGARVEDVCKKPEPAKPGAAPEGFTSCADVLDKWGQIPSYACQGKLDIVRLWVPLNVRCIGTMAFEGCTNLEEIRFEEGGTDPLEIGCMAFKGCAKLTKLSLPARIKCLDAGCFRDCANLKELETAQGAQPPTIQPHAFDGCAF